MTIGAQTTQISADHVWGAYYQDLIRTVAGCLDAEKQVVTLAEKAMPIDLGSADPEIAANYAFEAGNVLPAWNPETAAPDGLLCAYSAFLDNIDLGNVSDPDLRHRIHSARLNYQIANKNFATVRSQAVVAWIQHKLTEPGISFAAFAKRHFPLFTLAGQFLRGADSEFEAIMFEAYGAGYSDIADARLKCGIISGAAAVDTQTPFNMAVKRCISSQAASGDLLPEVFQATSPAAPLSTFVPIFKVDGFAPAYAEWQANSVHGVVAETITIAGGPLVSPSACPWPPAGGKQLGDFLKMTVVGADTSDPQPAINTWSHDFSVTVLFTGLDTFSVTPGEWYDPRMVKTYKDRLLPTAPRLFGEGGPMALLPTAVIIGFEPSIVISLENSDYQRFKRRCQAHLTTSVDIGHFQHRQPFAVGTVQSVERPL